MATHARAHTRLHFHLLGRVCLLPEADPKAHFCRTKSCPCFPRLQRRGRGFSGSVPPVPLPPAGTGRWGRASRGGCGEAPGPGPGLGLGLSPSPSASPRASGDERIGPGGIRQGCRAADWPCPRQAAAHTRPARCWRPA